LTLNIKKIEKQLGKQIRLNSISVGFDVAENFTGVCILKSDDKKITIEHLQVIKTNRKLDHFHRADNFIASLEKFKQLLTKYKQFKILVIEQCYYGINAQVLIHLAHFGILCYSVLNRDFDVYYHYGASTARMIIGFNFNTQKAKGNIIPHIITKGKNKGKEKKISSKPLVHDYLKTDFNVEINQEDEADAFVLSLAGLLS